ncbi:MAG: hypothetical protein SF182_28185 [Deltaproteobacteria bacterium]|nr:hypothetical protein [Deltaproteobacteria bacterium]
MLRMIAGLMVAMLMAAAPLRADDSLSDDTLGSGSGGSYHQEQPLGDDQPGVWSDFGMGMAAVGTNLGYMPAKFLYAMGGGLVGLMAWGVTAGDSEIANGILAPAFGGTWAVTPDMLRGKDPIYFSGPTLERSR